jgi:hypothetical protein
VAIEVIHGSRVMVALVPAEVRHAFGKGWSEIQALIAKHRAPAPAVDALLPQEPA